MEYKYDLTTVNLAQLIYEAGVGNLGLRIEDKTMYIKTEQELSKNEVRQLNLAVTAHIPETERMLQDIKDMFD